jgi:hypothetical protein
VRFSHPNPFHLIEAEFLTPPVVKLGRARAGVVRHLRRLLQRAAVLEIRRDPGRAKAVVAKPGRNAGGGGAVRTSDIFRPCLSGSDITTSICTPEVGPSIDGNTARFLLAQLWYSREEVGDGKSHFSPSYPFTGMGWAYNWDPEIANHVGVSEFIVRPGALITNVAVSAPEVFCAR